MAIRKIRTEGDPILNKISKEVTSMTNRNRELIEDMIDTMYEANGVGLAAPQVGVLKRIVVIDVSENGDEPMVLINPVIIEKDGTQTGSEGCLSVPGKHGVVTRAQHVICRALDENMQEREIEGTDLLARAIQHELDHLEGIIYTSKVEGDIMDNSEEEEE
ncbi:MAG: peptide deformylase [Lachnospiraceae bacterium]|nr:peptide deformylase [Lachnospiraceae bacterium]